MHHVYHTEAFILGSTPRAEASKLVRMFTSELGLVFAVAQGVRFDKSKLRYVIQDYSFAHVSLVRGKEVWRLTSAREETATPMLTNENRPAILTFTRIFSLVGRMVGEGEKNTQLFAILKEAREFLQNSTFTQELLSDAECIIVLKILHNLGYVAEKADLTAFIIDPLSENLVLQMTATRKLALSTVNNALKESHL